MSGRYAIYGEIASGGMASVLYGRLLGPVGFARAVAIKRLHPHIAREPAVVSMFIDEARICARLSHANVVPTIDVIETPGELALVMEYVHGCTLETVVDLMRQRGERMPIEIVGALMLGVLHGLQAAHEARNDLGEPLHIVHRDVSPQNIMVAVDGIARLFDFGIAKARGRMRSTPSGEVKGKLAYMAPEQFGTGPVDARVDVYGAAVVLWELLAGRPLFDAIHESALVHSVLYGELQGPKASRDDVSDELDALVMRGLARDPERRFASVREMARALERTLRPASQSEVSEWLNALAGDWLTARAEWLQQLQQAAEHTSATRRMPLPSPADVTATAADTPLADRHVAPRRSSVQRRKSRRWFVLSSIVAAAVVSALALWTRAAPERATKPPPGAAANTRMDAPSSHPPPPPSAEPPKLNGASDWDSDPPTQRGEALSPELPRMTEKPARAVPIHSRARPRRESPAASEHEKPGDCREPFVIDALGVKRWKRECL